jgi:hypothetical protein
MKITRFIRVLLVTALIVSLSLCTVAAAGTTYSAIIGGSNDIYLTSGDGKLFVTTNKGDAVYQIKEVSNAKMAANDMYFGLWVLDKTGDVYHYQENYETKNKFTDKKKIEKLNKVKAISVGSEGIYALKNDGTVWGVNNNLKAFEVKGLKDVTSISVRDFDVLALKKDGTVWQWRDDALEADFVKKTALKQVAGLKNVKEISAGADSGLALLKDNTVWQWSFSEQKPVKVTGFTAAKAIEAGRMEAYVVDGKGEVWTWSTIDNNSKDAKKIKGLTGITRLAAAGKDSYDGFSSSKLLALDKNNKIKLVAVE